MATRRLYVPLSVSTHLDSRIAEAGDIGELLWYRLLQVVKANESDGMIGHAQAVKLHSKRAVDALVRVGLLRPSDDGKRYALAGWLDWNLSAAQIDARRRADRDRKANGKPTDPDPFPPGNGTDSDDIPSGIQPDPKGREGKLKPDEVDPVLQPTGVGSPAGSGDDAAQATGTDGQVLDFGAAMRRIGGRS